VSRLSGGNTSLQHSLHTTKETRSLCVYHKQSSAPGRTSTKTLPRRTCLLEVPYNQLCTPKEDQCLLLHTQSAHLQIRITGGCKNIYVYEQIKVWTNLEKLLYLYAPQCRGSNKNIRLLQISKHKNNRKRQWRTRSAMQQYVLQASRKGLLKEGK
jgi:hypothetical protein